MPLVLRFTITLKVAWLNIYFDLNKYIFHALRSWHTYVNDLSDLNNSFKHSSLNIHTIVVSLHNQMFTYLNIMKTFIYISHKQQKQH